MSCRDLAFRILLISIVRFSTTSIIRPQRLLVVRLSPEPARSLEDIPGRWRTANPEFKAPQIEIQLMKGHVSPGENWMFTNEYKYSGEDYHGAAKVTPAKDEKKIPRIENGDMEAREKEKENDVSDNIVMPDGFIPQIGFRNIITVPTYCPEGQREDSRGRCRTVIT
ncbi:PREDICTED: uncharacterized protein LOC105569629 [Vollenhovia emeryi]|uniref:uncharacterized protein LOC105569629 n=1 Tax=Vollenhovia emeryi TaxID=411798 RepID=UPI0005F44A9F|nr:PREDICTED: uncharacterized protein LOC105569629 [Vollenhovia emeryi]